MRTAVSMIALVLAAAVVVLATTLTYGLTSEYGPAPNGGGVGEALSAFWSGGLTVALVVAVLLAVGVWGLAVPGRLRVPLVAGGAVLALLGVGLGMLVGNLALEQRCQERGAQHSAACPELR